MDVNALFSEIKSLKSFLCVGLDTDLRRIPDCLSGKKDPIFEFNRAIIDATADFCVAFKPNMAFYEVHGTQGWESLAKTVRYIRDKYPNKFIIADAKRGDITNTAAMYARSVFHGLGCDAVTIAPYMGYDAIQPFLEYEGRWAILLALTSNASYDDFQTLPVGNKPNQRMLFEEILERSRHWGHDGNMMYVVGATRAEMLQKVRRIVPDHFLLIPGVGQQGGNLADVVEHGINRRCGLLVNSSRGIIYADSSQRFAKAARERAFQLQQEMETHLRNACLI